MKYLTLIYLAFVSLMLAPVSAEAKLKVVASTSDIAALATAVGGPDAEVSSIAKGTQDPHYVEAKPSFMVAIRDADLLVINGLSLEIGWIPSLIKGARNPNVNPGGRGYVELGKWIEPIELPTGSVTRAMGDVHPDGNPHFTLDPVRLGDLAIRLAEKMGEVDTKNKDAYLQRAQTFKATLQEKTKSWQSRIAALKNKKLITYHPSLNYFMQRFGLSVENYIENKPGIPPTAQHTLDLIRIMKTAGIKLVLVDNFFDTKVAERIAKDVPGAKVVSVGIAVGSTPDLKSSIDVIEQLVKVIEANQ